MNTFFLSRRLTGILIAAALVTGCASQSSALYQWEHYQSSVYEYLKGDNKTDQIAFLEEGLQKIHAKGKTPPPGYHAHLGMLYAGTGQDRLAIEQLETEKKLFPESTRFMDFLLKKYKKKA